MVFTKKHVFFSIGDLLSFPWKTTVDGRNPKANHRWDGAKTLVNNGDKLPFPQLVSLPDFEKPSTVYLCFYRIVCNFRISYTIYSRFIINSAQVLVGSFCRAVIFCHRMSVSMDQQGDFAKVKETNFAVKLENVYMNMRDVFICTCSIMCVYR